MNNEIYAGALELIPGYLRNEVKLDAVLLAKAEEIRLRAGRKATVLVGEREIITGKIPITSLDLERVLEIATGASAYSVRDCLRAGYITAKGGYRIGVCGSAVVKNGGIVGFRELTSLAIRIPRDITGVAEKIMPGLISNGKFESTLIISPPGGGKTTFLRDAVRVLSDGASALGLKGMRVALADERGEIACVYSGVPQRNVGGLTDVMDGCPKAQAVMMLLRTMNPHVIALDEITAEEDILAIQSCANCGVAVIATAHAESINDLYSRPMYAKLLESGIFKNAVFITKSDGKRNFKTLRLGR